MATNVRNLRPLVTAALVAQSNAMRLDLMKLELGTIFHADQTPIGPGVVDPPLTLSDCEADLTILSAAYVTHIASACDPATGQGAHIAADAANVITTPAATDETSAQNRANELKAIFNAHIAGAYHPTADTTNTVVAADSTTLASLKTLVTALHVAWLAHFGAGMVSQALNLVAP